MGEHEAESSAIQLNWDPVADFIRDTEVSWPSGSRLALHADPLIRPQRLFPSTFLLFHSPHGSSTIGGIWHPSIEGSRPFKVGLGFPVLPVEAEGGKAKVVIDKKSVLQQVQRLGKGLVKKVEVVQ